MMAEKQFRADLYYRLKVFPISAPPCAIGPVIFRYWRGTSLRATAVAWESISRRFPRKTMKALVRWKWPGNIRELGNLIERAVIPHARPCALRSARRIKDR
jgi:Transcriptional regulator containing PAS, AAA-type ATPase, and DNA-binding domains